MIDRMTARRDRRRLPHRRMWRVLKRSFGHFRAARRG
jgi:hypothetical protein